MTLENLLAWSIQIAALALAGLLLPWLLRVREPRWQLRYYQALLGLCLLLPAIQPWRREVLRVTPEPETAAGRLLPVPPRSTPRPLHVEDMVLGGFAAGAALRALWLAAGLLTLRKFRAQARPLYPLPRAVEDARFAAGGDALICLADEQSGPVTFGLRVPVILLPPRFLDLAPEAQFAVACHEYLHVRRRDWLQHMTEEFVSILLWFHPAIWWLISRIRLAREQAVDAQVVRLTQARERYVDALISMSGARPALDLAPAPLFLKRRHLKERIYAIVKEVSMSKRRLVSSYLSIGGMLTATTAVVVSLFPLHGAPQIPPPAPRAVQTIQRDAPGVTVNTGGTILHRPGVRYPAEAMRAKQEGTVVIEATLERNGNVTDARVLSGPEGLRRAALESVLQWHFASDTAASGRAQVSITYTATGAMPPPPPPPGPPNKRIGSIDTSALPQSLQEALRPLARFEGRSLSSDVVTELRAAILDIEPHMNIAFLGSSGDEVRAILTIQNAPQLDAPSTPPPPADFPSDGSQRIRVGGNVQSAKLVNKVPPQYPPLARQARIQGVVRFSVLIDKDGSVKDMRLSSGHPLLVQAASEAIPKWTYQPTLLNGAPVQVVTVVDVNFTLSE